MYPEYSESKFSQKFWTDNDRKFITFKTFTERNEFIEFLREYNIPINLLMLIAKNFGNLNGVHYFSQKNIGRWML